jgi:uncharacterized protein
MEDVLVIKLNPARQETWRYTGKVLSWRENSVVIEAPFNRDDRPFHEILLKRGDRFVEEYTSDRWYNIYEIYDRDDGSLKAWYCNVSLPAEFEAGQIRFVDLALDLLVYPDGRQEVLDEDEFEALSLGNDLRQGALRALKELQELVRPEDGFRLEL